MIDERTEELAALYALDLLPPEEKSAFADRLARDTDLRRLVAELHESSAQLAHAAPSAPPPADLRARVLRDAAPRGEVVKFPRNSWVPWSIAAALALMGALGSQVYLKAKRENVRLQAEATRLAHDRATALARVQQLEGEAVALHRAAVEADKLKQLADAATEDRKRLQNEILALQEKDFFSQLKIDRLASLVKESPDALAIAVWDPQRQQGMLTVDHLPPPPDDKDYQLWIVDAAYPIPVDGGVFHPDVSGKFQMKFNPDKLVKTATPVFAVSLEKKGGVPKAEGPVVLLSK